MKDLSRHGPEELRRLRLGEKYLQIGKLEGA